MTASAPSTVESAETPTDSESRNSRTDPLDDYLRDYGATIASRELATALDSLDGLTPSQRQVLARMAGRIAADVLGPARRGVGDDATTTATVRTLFDPDEDVRDRR